MTDVTFKTMATYVCVHTESQPLEERAQPSSVVLSPCSLKVEIMSLQKGVTDFISETLTPMTPLALFQMNSHPPSLGLGGGSWGDRR